MQGISHYHQNATHIHSKIYMADDIFIINSFPHSNGISATKKNQHKHFLAVMALASRKHLRNNLIIC